MTGRVGLRDQWVWARWSWSFQTAHPPDTVAAMDFLYHLAAAATQAAPAATAPSKGFAIAWFDVLVVLVMLVAIRNGRKRGLSEELLPLGQWVAIIAVNALVNGPSARGLANFTKLSLFWSHLVVFVFLGVLVFLAFIWLKSAVGGKLLEADYFGRHEFSLGIVAALVRYGCMLVAALAILNSRLYTPEPVIAIQRERAASDIRIALLPAWSTVQHQVFAESESGKFIRARASFLLITSTPYDSLELRASGEGRRRERLVEEAIDGGKPKPAPSTNAPPK